MLPRPTHVQGTSLGPVSVRGCLQRQMPPNSWFNSNFHRDVWPLNRSELDPDFAAFWEERFDLAEAETIRDLATFDEPHQLSEGVSSTSTSCHLLAPTGPLSDVEGGLITMNTKEMRHA